MTARLTVIALPSAHRFRRDDDLVAALTDAVAAAGERLRDGDVVCVASKVVSLVEGATVRLAPGEPLRARREVARAHAQEIVAEAPQVLVTRTHHGFVCANGGVDASNVADGLALLLPHDPDASAARLHRRLLEEFGVRVGVLITDTFGRPWRMGQTDVAIGVAGVAALRDERGRTDLDGRVLEVTEAAVADELAGVADLVRDKASGTPFVLIRGMPPGEPGLGADLVRPLEQDLFPAGGPTAASHAVTSRRTVRSFAPDRAVHTEVLRSAVAAAATAPAPHHTRPWQVIRLLPALRRTLLDAMAERWRADLSADGLPLERIAARIARSDAILRTAPEVLVPFVSLRGAHPYPDARRTTAERDLFVLSGGAFLQALQVVLAGHGLGAAWVSSTVFCPETVREVLDLDADQVPLGMVAVGWPAGPSRPRPPVDLDEVLSER
jgi:coenzyme F420-0:L-glutamate ligase / coenzyme F420-1:gamma-L-glutamate ligase